MKYRSRKKQQTHPYEDKDEHRDKVICSRDGVFICQTEEVHDGGTHTQYTLDFVSWSLVGIDGPDLRLRRGPGSLLQVNLPPEVKTLKTFYKLHVPTLSIASFSTNA